MGGKVKSSLPPGMTGSCTGDPCSVVTGISVNGVSSSTGFPSTDNGGEAFAVEPVFSLNSAGTNPVTALDDAMLYNVGGSGSMQPLSDHQLRLSLGIRIISTCS